MCGAGKTEILLSSIQYALNNNLIIGFACPRKTLLIEIYERISEVFNTKEFGLIYGGYSYKTKAQFIFLTTHQLVKYKDYFDLLIIDEIDAFPYCDNYQLEKAAKLASKQFIYLSATVPSKYYNYSNLKIIKVIHRHHLQVMPTPQIILSHKGRLWLLLLKLLKIHSDQPMIIYVCSKQEGLKLARLLKLIRYKVKAVSSENINHQIIQDLKDNKINILVSTTVLERGITIKGINVIIYKSHHQIFNKKILIQICGRVGRNTEIYDGYIYYLCSDLTNDMQQSIDEIKQLNNDITKANLQEKSCR